MHWVSNKFERAVFLVLVNSLFDVMSQCQGHKSCYSTHMFMSRNVTASIKKKFGGLEHGDECPKRISRSQVSDLVLKKRVCLFSVNPKDPNSPPPK